MDVRNQHFKMQVISCSPAGLAHGPQFRAGVDYLAFFDHHFIQVRIPRKQTVLVLNFNQPSETAPVAGKDNLSLSRGQDRRAAVGFDVDPIVRTRLPAFEFAHAIGGRQLAVRRLYCQDDAGIHSRILIRLFSRNNQNIHLFQGARLRDTSCVSCHNGISGRRRNAGYGAASQLD